MPQVSPEAVPPPTAHGWRRWHERPATALVVKPPRERLTELVGSLLLSALAAAVMCVVLVLVESYRADGGQRMHGPSNSPGCWW